MAENNGLDSESLCISTSSGQMEVEGSRSTPNVRKKPAKKAKKSVKPRDDYSQEEYDEFAEDKRQKRRQNRPKLSEERLKRNKEYKRQYRANLSDEQRQRYIEYRRRYRANLSEQQRQRDASNKRPYVRSEAQRIQRNEYFRKRRANFTKDQHEKVLERKRQRYRERKFEKASKQYQKDLNEGKLTDEQYRILLEAMRHEIKYKPRNKSLKPRRKPRKPEKASENNKNIQNIKHNIMDKIDNDIVKQFKRKRRPCKRKRKTIYNKIVIPDNLNQTQGEMNALTEFINRVEHYSRLCSIDNVIDNIDKELYSNILNMFNFDFAHQFFVIYLMEIFKMWYKDNSNSLFMCHYNDLLNYIGASLNHIKKQHTEYVVTITCSLNNLKAYDELAAHSEYLINRPYVSMRVKFPGFTFIHENITYDELDLAYNLNDLEFPKQDVQLYFKPSDDSDLFTSEFVMQFLNQLKSVIVNMDENYISAPCRTELLEAIEELEYDVSLCTHSINTNFAYYIIQNKYPYVRCINQTANHVKLYQSCYPRLSFRLEDFNVAYTESSDGANFLFDEIVHNLSECLLYKCTLCDDLAWMPSDSMHHHLSECHGFEKDWSCSYCKRPFSADLLSKYRWKHNCIS